MRLFDKQYTDSFKDSPSPIGEGVHILVITKVENRVKNGEEWVPTSSPNPFSADHRMDITVTAENGRTARVVLFGGEPFKSADGKQTMHKWLKAFINSGCGKEAWPQQMVGKPAKILFYRQGEKGYTNPWNNILPVDMSDADVERYFKSALKLSPKMRSGPYGLSEDSKYNTGIAPVRTVIPSRPADIVNEGFPEEPQF